MTTSRTLDGAVRLGAQEPRVCTRPPFEHSEAAEECLQLADAAGVRLDPWQRVCLRVMLSVNKRGRWAALENAILVARQNGKGEILLALTLYWLFLSNERLVVHTAHEFKTAGEAFLRLKAVLDANDWLNRRVKTERTSHGEEGYVMRSGARLRFLARSRSSGRGFTGDKVILDEAQELSALAMNALMPTLSARPNPMIVYTGTVPGPENDSAHWANLMKRGRSGTSTRLAWLEWNIGERLPSAALYDGPDPDLRKAAEVAWLEAAYAANPALGIRMEMEFVEGERESLSYLGYLRERLNLWTMDPPTMVIPMDTWLALVEDGLEGRPLSRIVGRRALGVDCPPSMLSTTIAAMGRNERGAWHGEIADRAAGTAWVPQRLGELTRKNDDVALVVIDPGSPAGALISDIEAEGVEVMQVTTRQHAQACGMLYTRCTELSPETGGLARGFVHLGDPLVTDALKVAVKRPGPEGAWLWNRKESGDDISAIVAMTLAGLGLSVLPEPVEPWGFWS